MRALLQLQTLVLNAQFLRLSRFKKLDQILLFLKNDNIMQLLLPANINLLNICYNLVNINEFLGTIFLKIAQIFCSIFFATLLFLEQQKNPALYLILDFDQNCHNRCFYKQL